MRIVDRHSHLHGFEFFMVHKQNLWSEIAEVIADVGASSLAGVDTLSSSLSRGFRNRGWAETRVCERTVHPWPRSQQRSELKASEFQVLEKDRVVVLLSDGVQKDKARQRLESLAGLYRQDIVDVGVQILPVRESRDIGGMLGGQFEEARDVLVSGGRCDPRVPLVLIGVAA